MSVEPLRKSLEEWIQSIDETILDMQSDKTIHAKLAFVVGQCFPLRAFLYSELWVDYRKRSCCSFGSQTSGCEFMEKWQTFLHEKNNQIPTTAKARTTPSGKITVDLITQELTLALLDQKTKVESLCARFGGRSRL
jgi:hypothetical protein